MPILIALGALACAGSSPPGQVGGSAGGGDEAGAGGSGADGAGAHAGGGGAGGGGAGGGGTGGQAATPDAAAPDAIGAELDASAGDVTGPDPDARPSADGAAPAGAVIWKIDNTTSIAGHPTQVLGAPTVIDTPNGKAVQFDGKADALMVEALPVSGLAQFTVELIFRPDADGAYEQRVFHMSQTPDDSRVLFETRVMNGKFFLDVVMVSAGKSVLLYEPNKLNAAGVWHAVAVAFDGTRARTYVDGVEQFTLTIQWKPLATGRTAIGMRINEKSFFKGAMRLARITPRALAPAELLKADDQP